MKSAGKARNNGLYRHIRTSKEIIRNLLNDSINNNTPIIPYTQISVNIISHPKHLPYYAVGTLYQSYQHQHIEDDFAQIAPHLRDH